MLTSSKGDIYRLPPLDLLTTSQPSDYISELNDMTLLQANKIVNVFRSLGLEVELKNVFCGANITRYDVVPNKNATLGMIMGFKYDLADMLGVPPIRVASSNSSIGIEIPNDTGKIVTLGDVVSSHEFRETKSELPVAIGVDVEGNYIIGDISQMPHIIISGHPGSGKSICMWSMIMSLLYKLSSDDVKLILVDPTKVQFNPFRTIPHLMKPIITDLNESIKVFKEIISEIERRYRVFSTLGVNNLNSYNELAKIDGRADKIPRIVVFIDELADMILQGGKEVEDNICLISQMGHIVGIHLVLATMRSTTDVITENLRANIQSRIAFSVKSRIDSQIVIDEAGAECIYLPGDMLYKSQGHVEPVRVQGCYTSIKDVKSTVAYIMGQQ